ncbi:GNAT family N-acetyltransferase [Micrococcus sp. FDAARGOS_333]|uniref:GNAT family N-acetyltransferase n=1 Tax=Micrococcus sp. FDAARGOS_333 TaxID=1930558 RepID=UPI000B4E2A91|nr:GNAT family N-acetyltransferase [Micrococcus sp. FDAARGOS_333]PNL16770.1 N-acetyltransferase [Micrococcus sp. FDAARGOS_333]PNL18779.1 N-acetyltransferase [Micrococcus sp. FDAARGOS_333]
MTETTPTVDQPQVREAQDRYAIHADGSGDAAGFTEFVEHTAEDGTRQRIFPHTEVGQEWGGHGLASILVREALTDSVRQGFRIVPVCPYVRKWLASHEDVAGHVDEATDAHLALLDSR